MTIQDVEVVVGPKHIAGNHACELTENSIREGPNESISSKRISHILFEAGTTLFLILYRRQVVEGVTECTQD